MGSQYYLHIDQATSNAAPTENVVNRGGTITPIGWETVYKSADEAITADQVLGADATLKFTTLLNTKYLFEIDVFFSTAATPDFQWSLTHAGTTSFTRYQGTNTAGGDVTQSVTAVQTAASVAVPVTGAGVEGRVRVEGYIEVGATGGEFAFNWAQNTSDAGATTVRKGSVLRYRSVA